MGETCHMACDVRVSLAHRGRAGFVVEILCHGVSPASSSASHKRQLNGISTRRKLSETTPSGRLQIAHRCHPRIVRGQRGWHWGPPSIYYPISRYSFWSGEQKSNRQKKINK